MSKSLLTSIAAALVLSLSAGALAEDKQPSATLEIDETQVAFIASGSLGGGVLDYQGDKHEFSIGGLGVGGFGISEIKAKGEVYDLDSLADFEGVYGEARAGFAVGEASAGGLWLANPNGVTIHIDGHREGLALSLGADGVLVDLKD